MKAEMTVRLGLSAQEGGGIEGTIASAGGREMETVAQKQDIDEKQRVSHFHGDKGALMNLNQYQHPVGKYY